MEGTDLHLAQQSEDTVLKVVAGSSKEKAEEELGEESSKRQKIGEGSEPAEESKDKESDELDICMIHLTLNMRGLYEGDNEKKVTEEPGKEGGDSNNDQEKEDDNVNSNNVNTASNGNITNNVNAVSSIVNAAGIEVNAVGAKTSIELPDESKICLNWKRLT
ncbi:hypothetical protein Tco_1025252 [Tanacetum coccineum]